MKKTRDPRNYLEDSTPGKECFTPVLKIFSDYYRYVVNEYRTNKEINVHMFRGATTVISNFYVGVIEYINKVSPEDVESKFPEHLNTIKNIIRWKTYSLDDKYKCLARESDEWLYYQGKHIAAYTLESRINDYVYEKFRMIIKNSASVYGMTVYKL